MDEEGSTKTRPSKSGVDAGIDQAETHANDPANASGPDYVGRLKGSDDKSTAGNPGVGSRLKGYAANRKKRLLLGSGIGALLVLLPVVAFVTLLPFKLIHLRELLAGHFDQRLNHMTSIRMGKIWVMVVDAEGNKSFEKRSGHYIRDKVYNLRSGRLMDDLTAKGFKYERDPVTSRIKTINGESVDKLKDSRSKVRQDLKTRYPEEGFIKRSIRAKKVYVRLGIPRRFFENTKEKADKLQAEMVKKLRDKLIKGEKPLDLSAGSHEKIDPNETPEQKADRERTTQETQVTNDEVNKAATKVGQDFIDDPNSSPPVPRVEVDPVVVARNSSIEAAKGAANVTRIAADVCHVKTLTHEVVLGAEILRARPLLRYVGILFAAADQLKTGEHVNGAELNALMNYQYKNIETSPALQLISGSSTTAKIKTKGQFAIHLKDTKGFGGDLAKLDDTIKAIPGTNSSCKVITNPFFTLGATVATIGGDLFTGGSLSIAGLSIGAAGGFIITTAEQILIPIATNMVAGLTVHDKLPPDQRGDALVAGSDLFFNKLSQGNGGRVLSAQEAYTINIQIAQEKREDQKNLPLLTKIASLDNPDSFLSKALYAIPTSKEELGSGFTSFASLMNPIKFFNFFGMQSGLIFTGAANAETINPYDAQNPFSIDQYGLTDTELNQYEPLENEDFILNNPDMAKEYQDFVIKCLESDNPEDLHDSACTSSDEKSTRFRVYHFDTNLTAGVSYMAGTEPGLPQDDAGLDSGEGTVGGGDSSDSGTGGAAPTGTAAQLAQQILDNKNITKSGRLVMFDLTAAANGNVGSANAPISEKLLSIILLAAQTHTFAISAIESGGTGHCHDTPKAKCPTDHHYTGDAFDVNIIDGQRPISGRDTKSNAFISSIMASLPPGSGIGESGCGIGPTLPAGVEQFPDSCNHLHIQVPAGTP